MGLIHPEACGCCGSGGEGVGLITCWYCIHRQHTECTAAMHGNPNARCPRVGSEYGEAYLWG